MRKLSSPPLPLVLRLVPLWMELKTDVDPERHLDSDGVKMQIPVERRTRREFYADPVSIDRGILTDLMGDAEDAAVATSFLWDLVPAPVCVTIQRHPAGVRAPKSMRGAR